MTTRTQVAEFLATRMEDNRETVIKEAAAWLVATKKVRQAEYLVNDVAKALHRKGYLYAKVSSAHELDDTIRQQVETYLHELGRKHVEVEYRIDERLIAGIKIETPTEELDASIRMKLDSLVERLQG
jgi:F0F1-type ATP synthase delta subunit